MSKTFVYEVAKPFEFNNRQYQKNDLLFEIEGRERLGIGDMVNGMIVNPIPAKIYTDRIRPYRNMVESAIDSQVLVNMAMVNIAQSFSVAIDRTNPEDLRGFFRDLKNIV